MRIPLPSVGFEANRPEHALARLHPVTQLAGAVLLLVGTVSVPASHQSRRLFPLAVLMVLGLVLIRARPTEFLRGLKYLILFFALVLLWPLLASADAWQGLQDGALSAAKILLIYTLGFLLVRSSSRWQVAGVLEWALRPFARLSRVPLMMALTLGILPVLGVTATHLYASFAGRTSGQMSRQRVWIRNLPLLLGAYFARSLDRAERLSRALVARHFCGRLGPRQSVCQQLFHWTDLGCLLFVSAGFALSIWL